MSVHWPATTGLCHISPTTTRCCRVPARGRHDGRASGSGCCAANRVRGRIASPGMFLEAEPLPHLICSRPMFIGGVKDEADQHGDAGRVGGSDSGAIFAGGQDGAEPYPRRVHGGYGLSPQVRDAAPSGGSTESALWPTTWAADL